MSLHSTETTEKASAQYTAKMPSPCTQQPLYMPDRILVCWLFLISHLISVDMPIFFFTRKSCCYKRWCHLPERKQIVLLCQLSLLATTVHAALTFRVFTPSIPFHIVGLTYRSTRLCQGKEEAKRQCGNSKQRNLYIEEILFKSHCNLNPTGLDGAGLGLWFYFLLMMDKLEQAGLSGPAGNMGSWSLLPT